MKKKTKIKIWSIALCMLVIGTQAVTIGTAVTPHDVKDIHCEKRVFIIGVGRIYRGHWEKSVWVYCNPLCILVIGNIHGRHILGPNRSIDLLFSHFVGFVLPFNHWITPVIGFIDADAIGG